MPYAIDFLNPAPDFERDRITPHYFDLVVEKMADAGDRSRAAAASAQQSWPRWAQMTGAGRTRHSRCRRDDSRTDPIAGTGTRSCAEQHGASCARALAERDARAPPDVRRPRCSARSSGRSSSTPRDEARVKRAAETLWRLGERVAPRPRDATRACCASSAERRRDRAGARSIPATASRAPRRGPTRSSCPTRCSSPSTTASRPAGAGYSQRLAELFDERAADGAVPRAVRRAVLHADRRTCSRRCSRATATGAARRRRRGSRSSTGARCRPGASSSSCATRSSAAGVPTMICDPRDLSVRRARRAAPPAGSAHRPGLPPRAHQRHRGAPGRVPRAGRRLPSSAPSASPTAALQDPAQEGVLRRADRRALRVACSPADERDADRRARAVDALVEDGRRRDGRSIDLPAPARQREQFVLKPNDEYGGTGVTLGWETDETRVGRGDRARRRASRDRGWVAQERIAIRRETFPGLRGRRRRRCATCSSTSRRTCSADASPVS